MNNKNTLKQANTVKQNTNNSSNKKTKQKELDSKWVMNNVICWYKWSQNLQEKLIYRKGRIVSETVQTKGNEQFVDVILEQENGFNQESREENLEGTFDDMVKMNILNESELISNLKQRYNQDNIFTYIGPTLIVLNPYKIIPNIFSNEIIDKIKSNLNISFDNFGLDMQQPHIYSISALAYKNLIQENKKQAIVISGESGAGKTENARYSMRFLTQISSHDEKLTNQESIEEKILSCNPVLEAFGNAKTVRNDNSSRFGKYVQIEVVKKRIIGATINKYLLEKSRVIHLSQGERNYHIFYHLLQSKNKNLLEQLNLKDKKAEDFNYLNQSDCQQVDGINDQLLFDGIIESFNIMKFEEQLQLSIFRILSAILYLGNLQFSNDTYQEGLSPCKVANEDVLILISKLLDINQDELQKALIFKTITVKNESTHKPVDIDLCIQAKNTLSKALYDNLFNWLVFKLNDIIKPSHQNNNQKNGNNYSNNTIGLLDIFGFENFKENSFEQLCINYTNENLQQLYIAYVFKNEELIFKEDGLEQYLSNLSYEDNTVILETLNKSYKLLNDSCKTAKDDLKYLLKLKNDSNLQELGIIQFPKVDNGTFTINHTQNPVVYKVDGFNSKNIDELSLTLRDAIVKSNNQYISNIFASSEDNKPNQGKFLGEKFSNQMKDLMEELNSSDVHFVRCVKTNEVKKCDNFLEGYVLQQIEYLGVLNSIQVRKSTYPQRRIYISFFKEYKICHDEFENKQIEDIKCIKNECKLLIKKVIPTFDDKMILFGSNKIYMKMEFESSLEQIKQAEIKRKRTKHAICIQIYYRYFKFHVKFQRKLKGIKDGTKYFNNKFYNQKIFSIYDDAFKEIKSRARMTVLKQFYSIYSKSIKKSFTKQVFNGLKENRRIQNEIIEQEKERKRQIESQQQEEIQRKQDVMKRRQEETQRQQEEQLKKQEEQLRKQEELLRQQEEQLRKQQEEMIRKQQELEYQIQQQRKAEENQMHIINNQNAIDLKNKQIEEQMKKKASVGAEQKSPQVQHNYNQLLNEQFDVSYSSTLSTSTNYQTSMVEPSGAVIDKNKFYYQENEEEMKKQENNSTIDINNYNTKLVQDWNQFSSNQEFSGDCILIPRPTEEENERAIKLASLLDTKSVEKVNETEEYADDCKFKISDIEEEALQEIKNLDLIGFYKMHLNKRTNLLGVKKDEKDILKFQKKALTKGSLIQVNDLEKKSALQHFVFMIDFIQNEDNHDIKHLTLRISEMTLICLKKSTQFYNEIVTQFIKQLNKNKKESITIKLLQYLKVFLYCFAPDDEFLSILMHFLIFYLHNQQWKDNEKIKNFILYVIPSIIRKIDQENPRRTIIFSSLIPQYEISALIQKQKIPIPIVFSTGLSICVCADSWDTVEQLKEKIMDIVQINADRIKINYLQIFELQFEDNSNSERMLLPDQYLWDILYEQNQQYIEKVQIQKEQNNGNISKDSETFMSVLMIRVLFPFTLYPEDIAGISLIFSQVYFDIYVGKQIFEDQDKLIQLSALFKVINDYQNGGQTDPIQSLPIIMDPQQRQDMVKPILEEYGRIKGKFSLLQSKYIYLMIAKENQYYMGLQIPVKYIPEYIKNEMTYENKIDREIDIDGIIVLKPTYFFITTAQTKKKVIEYQYNKVIRWGRSKEGQKEHILINTKDNAKHLIQSRYASQIEYYFQEAKNLLKDKNIQIPSVYDELLQHVYPNQSHQ